MVLALDEKVKKNNIYNIRKKRNKQYFIEREEPLMKLDAYPLSVYRALKPLHLDS